MIVKRSSIFLLATLLASCATTDEVGTIADLDNVQIELKDADVDGGLEKAMAGYQKFLEETPESALTPEAIRRLADLKVEKEYGVVTGAEVLEQAENVPSVAKVKSETAENGDGSLNAAGSAGKQAESEKDFEQRVAQQQNIQSAANEKGVVLPPGEAGADLTNAGAEEAIRLYTKLLEKYPQYERNDQVLYQLSRAYEEIGKVDEAMSIMNRLAQQFPTSRYLDEVHFRRGEYYFTRKKYIDAEEAYGEILKYGVGSVYYERALYKRGWTFYKQELYEEALHEFFTLLDYKVSIGYDFEQTEDDIERKRISDTFRVVSLGFSNLGGASSVQEYFNKNGSRNYEDSVYRELAEFYFDKRRYSDAATTYNTFVDANPFHLKSPHFSMRVIDIYMKGGFPRLVISAKKQFASTYGLQAEYWSYFNQAEFPEVLGYLKTNLMDLANHYHALYQDKKFKKDKPENFAEASNWYREFLKSFPKEDESAGINYQLAELLLENKNFGLAAVEYEHSAYDYPVNENSNKAAYAAVYAYREHLKAAPPSQITNVKREIIRSSLRLVDTFPRHEKATIVLGAAVDDLFNMRDYALAIKVGRRLIEEYPAADAKIIRGAWLVVAHSSYEIESYHDAELAYVEVLERTAKDDKGREKLVDNLAASVYKQGEQARAQEDYKAAVRHFLRIAKLAPESKIRPTAEYDAAAVLIQIMDLEQAANVLLAFRQNYPGHELQRDVTKKIAFVYKEMGKFALAAKEFERIASEETDEELVREAMLTAAELYEKAEDTDNSLRVYKQFVVKFPKPLEFALETYYKIAMIYKSRNEMKPYRDTLQHIIVTDAKAGDERTDRTRYLAAQSSLVIIEPEFDDFIAIKLVEPFKKSLTKKQKAMKSLVANYTKLVDYKVADVTAASTFYIAEIYYNFNRSLLTSEKPKDLNEVEKEEFTFMLEEQAFPFEEKAIAVHEKNVELLSLGIYSTWIDRSIEKLTKLVPARYNKPEESTNYITKFDMYIYSSPRFVREDSSTGFIKNLELFRYTSQKRKDVHHETDVNADISREENAGETEASNDEGQVPESPALNSGATEPTGGQNGIKERSAVPQGDAQEPSAASATGSVEATEQGKAQAARPDEMQQAPSGDEIPAQESVPDANRADTESERNKSATIEAAETDQEQSGVDGPDQAPGEEESANSKGKQSPDDLIQAPDQLPAAESGIESDVGQASENGVVQDNDKVDASTRDEKQNTQAEPSVKPDDQVKEPEVNQETAETALELNSEQAQEAVQSQEQEPAAAPEELITEPAREAVQGQEPEPAAAMEELTTEQPQEAVQIQEPEPAAAAEELTTEQPQEAVQDQEQEPAAATEELTTEPQQEAVQGQEPEPEPEPEPEHGPDAEELNTEQAQEAVQSQEAITGAELPQ